MVAHVGSSTDFITVETSTGFNAREGIVGRHSTGTERHTARITSGDGGIDNNAGVITDGINTGTGARKGGVGVANTVATGGFTATSTPGDVGTGNSTGVFTVGITAGTGAWEG